MASGESFLDSKRAVAASSANDKDMHVEDGVCLCVGWGIALR